MVNAPRDIAPKMIDKPNFMLTYFFNQQGRIGGALRAQDLMTEAAAAWDEFEKHNKRPQIVQVNADGSKKA